MDLARTILMQIHQKTRNYSIKTAISRCPALHPALLNALCSLASYFPIFILLHPSLRSITVGPDNPQPGQATMVSSAHSADVYRGPVIDRDLGRGDAADSKTDISGAFRIFYIQGSGAGNQVMQGF